SFAPPGGWPTALTVHDDPPGGRSSALAWLDAIVVAPDELPATAGEAARWTLADETGAAATGSRAVFDEAPGVLGAALHAHIEPHDGRRGAPRRAPARQPPPAAPRAPRAGRALPP